MQKVIDLCEALMRDDKLQPFHVTYQHTGAIKNYSNHEIWKIVIIFLCFVMTQPSNYR